VSDSQARISLPNLTIVTFKMWAYSPKIAKIGNFWYIFAQKSYPLKRFLQYLVWARKSQVRTLIQNFTVLALKCGPTAPKIAKNRNFWYNFTHIGKFWGSTEKVEYRCTTKNLSLCNDTITVSKITPLHSVFVITNFVI